MLELMAAADDAEARGDASGALEIIGSEPWDQDGRLFWRPWRIERLEQVVRLGDLLPGWAVSRWILEQAMQAHQPSLRTGRLQALEHAVELRGGLAALPGVDALDARSRVMDNDWVYRQLYLYEYGGLATFLRRSAAGDLVAGSDRIWAWVDAPMRALRLVGRGERTLRWIDLATDELVEVANLGGGALLLPGECALGRLVPTALGEIFEGVPLRVSAEVARVVARDPAGWLAALRSESADDGSSHATVRGSHLLSDVPPTAWQLAMLSYAGAGPDDTTPDVLVDAVIATVRDAMAGALDEESDDDEVIDVWPCLAAALVHPLVMERLPEAFGADDAPRLIALSNRLVGPAADICRALADPLPDAA
jgi:hypothetical protein